MGQQKRMNFKKLRQRFQTEKAYEAYLAPSFMNTGFNMKLPYDSSRVIDAGYVQRFISQSHGIFWEIDKKPEKVLDN